MMFPETSMLLLSNIIYAWKSGASQEYEKYLNI